MASPSLVPVREEAHKPLGAPKDGHEFRAFTPRVWNLVTGEPEGIVHAAHAESDVTVCGLEVANLIELPYIYSGMGARLRCLDCERV